jgi:hypothetical protein
MTGEDQAQAFKAIGTIASTAGLTTFAMGTAKGIIAGYQTYASPYTSLAGSEEKLERVRSRLQGLSPKRREEIEIATRTESSNHTSLKYLEDELETRAPLIHPVTFSNSSSRREYLVSQICSVDWVSILRRRRFRSAIFRTRSLGSAFRISKSGLGSFSMIPW